MSDEIRLDQLPPASAAAAAHVIAAMKDGLTERLTILHIANFVIEAIQEGAPEALDTLAEIAAALNGDPDVYTTLVGQISGCLKKSENLADLPDPASARNNLGIGDVMPDGFKNRLINPLGTINQRGYSSGAATSGANEYAIDRWRVVVPGQSMAFTVNNGYATIVAPAGGVEQVIEGGAILPGTYVLSWEGTATATVDGNAVSNGGTVTLTGGANVTVRFSNGTFAKPQLEPGDTRTDFDARHPQQELDLCYRYRTPKIEVLLAFGSGGNGTFFGGSTYWPVTMRAVPTVYKEDLVGNSGKYSTNTGDNNSPGAGALVSSITPFGFFTNATGPGSNWVRFYVTADAEF